LIDRPDEKAKRRYAPLLSTVRFGPGVITILSLIALVAVAFYLSGHTLFAGLFVGLDCLLFAVKSMEIIQLSRPDERTLIGRRCVVVSGVGKGKGGVVRVYEPTGSLDPELWSAESEDEISEGEEAVVVSMRTIILIVKPTGTAGSINL
jgi:membrane protein implicated in regulation of membrane protease activity